MIIFIFINEGNTQVKTFRHAQYPEKCLVKGIERSICLNAAHGSP